jgi:hypothetical protein
LTHWDPASGKCECCPTGFTFDSLKLKCACASDFPYYDVKGKICIACNSPSIWDEANAKCISCLEGSSYNA